MTPSRRGGRSGQPFRYVMPPKARPTGLNAARAADGPLCPKPDDRRITRRGLISRSTVGPRSHRSSVPGRKFSTITSLSRTSSSNASRPRGDRKSTRLNSSHITISYAVFCLKKKKKKIQKIKKKKKNKKKP